VKTSCEVKNRRERCLADGGEKLGQWELPEVSLLFWSDD
jgi:hypothetical protein